MVDVFLAFYIAKCSYILSIKSTAWLQKIKCSNNHVIKLIYCLSLNTFLMLSIEIKSGRVIAAGRNPHRYGRGSANPGSIYIVYPGARLSNIMSCHLLNDINPCNFFDSDSTTEKFYASTYYSFYRKCKLSVFEREIIATKNVSQVEKNI